MKKYSERIFKKCIWLAVACCLFTACEKEHLQPDTVTGSETPLVFINAILGTDTVHLEGGVNSYIGASWVADTGIYRYFCFYLYSTLTAQPIRCFKIYVNNAALTSGNPQQDLDSTITVDSLGYQNYSSGFSPSSATVEWYDSTGVQYTSSIVPQSNTFVITSVEDVYYENRTYKKATIEFNCTLMDNSFTNLIPLTNGTATLLFVADPHPWHKGESIIEAD